LEYEIKFVVPNHSVHPVVNFLSSICQPDSVHSGATVSSIYFDSVPLHSLNEKINSDFLKSKTRIRWYRRLEDNAMSSVAFIETKNKTGSQRRKARVESPMPPLELDQVALEDSRLPGLLSSLPRHGEINQHHLFPTMLIRYQRRRLVEPRSGSRISIDSDIQVARVNRQLLPRATCSRLQNAVIEVKGQSADAPDSLLPMIGMGARKVSFSKYLACFAASHHIVFDPR